MSLFSVEGVKVAGISASVPKNEVSNWDFTLLSEKERDLLIRKTGIESRRVVNNDLTAGDLCRIAAQELLSKLDWEPSSIDILIFVTQTPDYITPATAVILQDQLGLSKNCLAFDMNLGCSGYVYGLSTAAGLLRNFPEGRALLLVGDVSSSCVSAEDKSAAPIFSDAGSATALERKEGAKPIWFNLQSDGKGFKAIIIPGGGYRHPLTEEALMMKKVSEGITRNESHLILNGIDVFNFSIREVPKNVTALLDRLNKQTDQVDHYVFHQANMMINETIRKKLKLEKWQVPYSLKKFGNTSSATIPITMITELYEDMTTKPLSWVVSGFGVGLSWGAAYLETDSLICPPLIEV